MRVMIQSALLKDSQICIVDSPKRELKLFASMFPEMMTNLPLKQDDMKKLYGVLKKIIRQSEEMNLDYKEEIKVACKKNFSRRLENSAIW